MNGSFIMSAHHDPPTEGDNQMKMKKLLPLLIILTLFETVAVTLWLTKSNIFYLFNFSYIGLSISLGIYL